MFIYKFTVEAEHEKYGHDVSEHYIAAYSYEHAKRHVKETLNKGGWKINDMTERDISLIDIRDKCNHITD